MGKRSKVKGSEVQGGKGKGGDSKDESEAGHGEGGPEPEPDTPGPSKKRKQPQGDGEGAEQEDGTGTAFETPTSEAATLPLPGIDDEENEFIEALEAELEAAKAEQTAGTKKSVLAKPVLETVCTECQTPVDPLSRGVRLMCKQQRTFGCHLCNCKCTMLSTMFVSLPIDDFKRLSETQKVDFWNSTGTSRADLKQAVEEQVILTRIKSKWSESKGDFQPLSWYQTQGYDTSTFASDLESEWNNDMGCMTYRVSIHGGGERLQEDLARTEITKLLRKQPGESTPKKLRTEPEAPPEETEGAGVAGWTAVGAGGYPEETGDTPPTSQSSTTTTSSSSSQRHKFKKGKRGKKEKSRKLSKKDRKKAKARLE